MAMWGNSLALTIFLCCLSFISRAQANLLPRHTPDRSWFLLVAPNLSHSRMPPGYGITYPGPPTYVDLELREPLLFAVRIEAGRQRPLAGNWSIKKAIGFSTYSFIQYLDYDREASTGTALSDRYDHTYVYGTIAAGRIFTKAQFRIVPFIGVTVNRLIRAAFTHTNQSRTFQLNYTQKYKPWSIGWELGIQVEYRLNERTLIGLRPSVNKIQRKYETEIGDRVLYSYGLGLVVLRNMSR